MTEANAATLPDGPPASQPDLDIDVVLKRYILLRRLYAVGRLLGYLIALVFIVLSMLQMINIFIGMTIPFLIIWGILVAPKQAPFDFRILNGLLAQKCDPYEYAQAYHKLLAIFKKKSNEQNACYINISLGLLLQGQKETMLTYLTTATVDKMSPDLLHAYYDVWSRYYFATADLMHLDLAAKHVNQIMQDYGEALTDRGNRTLDNIALYRAILTKDIDTGSVLLGKRNYFLRNNTELALPLQWVEYHYLHACLDECGEDYRAMQENCIYVIHNGNTLDYVQQANQMLQRVPSA
jgi:hypothetical protein